MVVARVNVQFSVLDENEHRRNEAVNTCGVWRRHPRKH